MKQFTLEKHTGALAPRIKYPDDVVENGVLAVDGKQYWQFAQLDTANGLVFGSYTGPSDLDDYTPEEVKSYKRLDERQFIRLCMSAGGATQADVVSANKNENLEFMWIMLKANSNEIDISDPDTQAGLSALDQLGYLPNGKQAVLDAWPTA